MEFTIPSNKFEKERRVIELHLEGKTIRQIAPIVHMSFRDISKKIKAYDKKISFELKNENTNPSRQKIKKPSISTQAFKLFNDGKNSLEVAIDLDMVYDKVRRYWIEFLRLKNMKDLYNIYIENEYHLDPLFRIYYFMRRNEIPIQEMENVLRKANDVIGLNQMMSSLKTEIERLKQMKNNYSSNQNIQPVPLGHLPRYYNTYF